MSPEDVAPILISAIQSGSLVKIQSANAAMKEAQDPIRGSASAVYGSCRYPSMDLTRKLAEGGKWVEYWLKEQKSERAARVALADQYWLYRLIKPEDLGLCKDENLKKMETSIVAVFGNLMQEVRQTYPLLEEKMEKEEAHQAELAQQAAKKRTKECSPDESEVKMIMDSFVRYEDRHGKNNAATERFVSELTGFSRSCVRDTVITWLDLGYVPPEPGL